MGRFGYVVLPLAVGLSIGAAVAISSRRPGQPPADTARIEARLEVQAAELRRLADGATVQDGGAERVRSELAGARRALEMLALKDEERRERERESREVERQVAARAREVAQYVDPAVTSPVAVAAVPDAAYAVLKRAHAEAFARGVVIVPYSTAAPVLLFLYSVVHRFGDAGDARVALEEVAAVLDGLEVTLENKIVKAATMVANGADELRSCLGRARGSVARGRAAARSDEPALAEAALKAVR